MSEEKWIRQDASELHREWVFFLGSGARAAWMYLKTYVKEAAYSQKRPNVAVALSHRSAAQRWNLTVQDVDEIVAAAVEAGQLMVGNGEWTVTDSRGFVSERTVERRNAAICPTNADESPQTATVDDAPRQTPTNPDELGQACHVTVSESGTESGSSESSLRSVSGGGDAAPPVDEWAGVPESQRPQWARSKPNHSWLMAERVLWLVHDEINADGRDWDPPTDDEIRRAMKDEGPLWWLVDKYGEEEAVAMFVHTVRNWTSLPSGWDQIRSQHRQIRDAMAKGEKSVKPGPTKRESVADAKARVKANLAQRQEVDRAA